MVLCRIITHTIVLQTYIPDPDPVPLPGSDPVPLPFPVSDPDVDPDPDVEPDPDPGVDPDPDPESILLVSTQEHAGPFSIGIIDPDPDPSSEPVGTIPSSISPLVIVAFPLLDFIQIVYTFPDLPFISNPFTCPVHFLSHLAVESLILSLSPENLNLKSHSQFFFPILTFFPWIIS